MRLTRVLPAIAIALAAATWSAAPAAADIYWSDSVAGLVGHADSDGGNPNGFFLDGIGAPSSLATDARHLFVAHMAAGTISRSELDGSGYRPSLIRGVTNVRQIAVHGDYVYWSDFFGSIGRARTDGTDVNPSFISGVGANVALAVDDEHIYWARPAGGTLARADLSGSNVQLDWVSGVSSVMSLAAGDGYVYFAQGGPMQIGRVSPNGTLEPAIVPDVVAFAVDFADGHLYWLGPTPAAIGRALPDGSQPQPVFMAVPSGTYSFAVSDRAVRTLDVTGDQVAFVARQPVETFSPQRTVSVTATGNAGVTFGDAALSGNGAGDFLLTGDACSRRTLAPGHSCTVGLRFAPVLLGDRSATLTLPSDADGSPVAIALTGTSVTPSTAHQPIPDTSGGSAPVASLQPLIVTGGIATGGAAPGLATRDARSGRVVTRTRCVTNTLSRRPVKPRRPASRRAVAPAVRRPVAPAARRPRRRAAATGRTAALSNSAARKRPAARRTPAHRTARRKADKRAKRDMTVVRKRCAVVHEPPSR